MFAGCARVLSTIYRCLWRKLASRLDAELAPELAGVFYEILNQDLPEIGILWYRPGAALRRRDRAAAGTGFNQCVLQYFRPRTAEARIRFWAMRGARRRDMGVNNKGYNAMGPEGLGESSSFAGSD